MSNPYFIFFLLFFPMPNIYIEWWVGFGLWGRIYPVSTWIWILVFSSRSFCFSYLLMVEIGVFGFVWLIALELCFCFHYPIRSSVLYRKTWPFCFHLSCFDCFTCSLLKCDLIGVEFVGEFVLLSCCFDLQSNHTKDWRFVLSFFLFPNSRNFDRFVLQLILRK